MAKKGMKRYYPEHEKNTVDPVPEINGKAKSGKVRANNVDNNDKAVLIKSFHAVPFTNSNQLPPAFPVMDNDLAVENLQNDFNMTAADLQDFENKR